MYQLVPFDGGLGSDIFRCACPPLCRSVVYLFAVSAIPSYHYHQHVRFSYPCRIRIRYYRKWKYLPIIPWQHSNLNDQILSEGWSKTSNSLPSLAIAPFLISARPQYDLPIQSKPFCFAGNSKFAGFDNSARFNPFSSTRVAVTSPRSHYTCTRSPSCSYHYGHFILASSPIQMWPGNTCVIMLCKCGAHQICRFLDASVLHTANAWYWLCTISNLGVSQHQHRCMRWWAPAIYYASIFIEQFY